jgi:site-specific recombinase XerD
MSKPAKTPPSFATLVQAYFAEYLTQQRALSPQTIAAYRDAFVLFLEFAQRRLGKSPTAIALADMTPDLITAFLNHLEQQRHNCVRSRNARLAALRSFLKFAGRRDVSSLQIVERALGIPVKRFERPMFGYLSREEMLAVIDAPDGTWIGQRDHVLFLMLYNTGARVSEIIGVTVGDVVLDDRAACVHLHGKGRKQRSVPLWRSTVRAIRAWRKQNPQLETASPLLPNRNRTGDDAHQRFPPISLGGANRDQCLP